MTPDDRAAILAPLEEFSRGKGFVWSVEPLALALRDDAGTIVGGLIGELHWGWLRIDILAVEQRLRGLGWGGRLLAEAERLAAEAGCHHAWLDTFSFQARPFYEKAGYRVFGELADYPAGQSRFFLAKSLIRGDNRATISGIP
jgi:GNAT superfamily N-acetyltransferase